MATYYLLVIASCPASDDEYWYYNDSADTADALLNLGCYGKPQRTPKANTQLLNRQPASAKPPCNAPGAAEPGTIYQILDNSDPAFRASSEKLKRAPHKKSHNRRGRK